MFNVSADLVLKVGEDVGFPAFVDGRGMGVRMVGEGLHGVGSFVACSLVQLRSAMSAMAWSMWSAAALAALKWLMRMCS